MKKMFAMLLAVVMVLLAGCQSATSSSSKDEPKSGTSEKPKVVTLYFGSCTGPAFEANELLGTTLAELSGGKMTANYIPYGTLDGEPQNLQSMISGAYDLSVCSDTAIVAMFPELGWILLPYLFSSFEEADQYSNYSDGWIYQEMERVLAEHGLILLSSTENGFRSIAYKGSQIKTQSDFEGRKFRVPESAEIMAWYDSCKAMSVAIPFSDMLPALQTGIVDGIDNTLENLDSFGILDEVDYYLETNYQYSSGRYICSKSFWDSLTEQEQQWLKETAFTSGEYAKEGIRKKLDEIEETYSQKGVVFYKPDAAFDAELKEIATKIWSNFAENYDPEIMDRIFNEFGIK